jgi:hypothetical protein
MKRVLRVLEDVLQVRGRGAGTTRYDTTVAAVQRGSARVPFRQKQLEARLGESEGIERGFVVGMYAALAAQPGESSRGENRQHHGEEHPRERDAALRAWLFHSEPLF